MHRRDPHCPKPHVAQTARRAGVTLIELVVVIAIVGAIAAFVTVQSQEAGQRGWDEATKKSQLAIRTAILGDPARAHASGYLSDMRELPATIAELMGRSAGTPEFDPITKYGWRGPYLTTSTGVYIVDVILPLNGFTAEYGNTGDAALLDAWSNPIVLQTPLDAALSDTEVRTHARLVSAGPNGILETPRTGPTPQFALFPPLAQCGDDIVLYLSAADRRLP